MRAKRLVKSSSSIKKVNKRSPRQSVPQHNTASIHRTALYNEAELQILDARNFRLFKQNSMVCACAYKSWTDYWSHINQDPLINAVRYVVYEILQGEKTSTVSTYLGGVGVKLIESDLVSEKDWSNS